MSLIDRDALIDYIESEKSGLCSAREFQSDYIECINDMPVIDAVPVVHGHWQEISADDMYGSGSCETAGFICSNCGFDIESNEYDAFNYCPSCGAKMEGE